MLCVAGVCTGGGEVGMLGIASDSDGLVDFEGVIKFAACTGGDICTGDAGSGMGIAAGAGTGLIGGGITGTWAGKAAGCGA